MTHGHSAEAAAHAPAGGHGEGVQHPIRIYLWIWLLLFVLSTFSYLVDYFQLQGMLRWTLIILFMLLKAGFIVAIFMHIAWDRLALHLAILPPSRAADGRAGEGPPRCGGGGAAPCWVWPRGGPWGGPPAGCGGGWGLSPPG